VNAYPAWSPNGRCLVHTVDDGEDRDLRVLAIEEGWGRTLTAYEGFDGDPVWDPRGGRVLFATDRFGGIELAFLHLDDEVRRRCEG
jgi:TolB protein